MRRVQRQATSTAERLLRALERVLRPIESKAVTTSRPSSVFRFPRVDRGVTRSAYVHRAARTWYHTLSPSLCYLLDHQTLVVPESVRDSTRAVRYVEDERMRKVREESQLNHTEILGPTNGALALGHGSMEAEAGVQKEGDDGELKLKDFFV